MLATQLEKLAVLGDAPDHQALPAGNHGHLTGELPWLVASNHPFTVDRRLDDFHAPRQQHEKRNLYVTRLEQDISNPDLPDAS